MGLKDESDATSDDWKQSIMSFDELSRPFYATGLGPCPYLDNRKERRILTQVSGAHFDEALDILTEAGFRRSQTYLYKPACPGCDACIPVRIVVQDFKPGRTMRKVMARNEDLVVRERPRVATNEQFVLFNRYLNSRHRDGSMAAMDAHAFRQMVEGSPPASRLIEFRDSKDQLKAVSLTDYIRSGLSGVYKFFDPDDDRRSLGTMMILWHIERAKDLGVPFVYLGYWIQDSRKMSYKSRFMPLEKLERWRWEPLAKTEIDP